MAIHFDQLWGFRGNHHGYQIDPIAHQGLLPWAERDEAAAKETYQRFIEAFRGEQSRQSRGILPTSCTFDRRHVLETGTTRFPQAARLTLRHFRYLSVIAEFRVAIWSLVPSDALVEYFETRTIVDEQSDVYVVDEAMRLCICSDHSGYWWIIKP